MEPPGSNKYISCIRIAGVPILSPLIDDERRKELFKYKTKAMTVEKRLKCRDKLWTSTSKKSPKCVPVNDPYDMSANTDGTLEITKLDSSDQSLSKSFSPSKSDISSFNVSNRSSFTTTRECTSSDTSPDKCKTEVKVPDNNFNQSRHVTLTNKTTSNLSRIESTLNSYNCDDVGLKSNKQLLSKDVEIGNQHQSVIINDFNTKSALVIPPKSYKRPVSNKIESQNVKSSPQNLTLSPCKDLVLKCDIFLAMKSGKITMRSSDKENLNSSTLFEVDDGFVHGSDKKFENSPDNRTKEWTGTTNKMVMDMENNLKKKEDKVLETPPKLVRQNSYTLETPSPELVAYLEKQNKEDASKSPLKRVHTWTVSKDGSDLKSSENFKPFNNGKHSKKTRRSWNVEEAKQQWGKRKNSVPVVGLNRKADKCDGQMKSIKKNERINYNAVENAALKLKLHADKDNCQEPISNRSYRDSANKKKKAGFCASQKASSLPLLLNKFCNYNNNDDDGIGCKSDDLDGSLGLNLSSFSTGSVLTTTAEKEMIVTKPSCDNVIDTVSNVPFNMLPYTSPVTGESILPQSATSCDDKSVSSSFSKTSCENLLDEYDGSDVEQCDKLAQFNQMRLEHSNQLSKLIKKQEEELKLLSLSVEQQSSPSEVTHQLTTSSVVSDICSHRCCSVNNDKSPMIDNSIKFSPPVSKVLETSTPRLKTPCTRRLNFGCGGEKNEENRDQYSSREMEAAVIITAYVRGYLVRRLFKTDKVQQTISSITESMHCALKLNSEKNLTPSDIDLHNRLITQIETAFTTLHNIFGLPINAKMAIIRADREKKKTPRPNSNSTRTLSVATQKTIMRKQQKGDSREQLIKSATYIKFTSRKERRRKVAQGSETSCLRSHQKLSSNISGTKQPWK